MFGFDFDTTADRRQPVGHVIGHVRPPQAHQPCQLLLGQLGFKLGLSDLPCQFGIKGVFTALCCLGKCTGLAEFGGQFGGSIGGNARLLQIRHHLEGRDRIDPGDACFCGQRQRAFDGNELRLSETGIGNGHTLLTGQHGQDVVDDQPFQCAIGP